MARSFCSSTTIFGPIRVTASIARYSGAYSGSARIFFHSPGGGPSSTPSGDGGGVCPGSKGTDPESAGTDSKAAGSNGAAYGARGGPWSRWSGEGGGASVTRGL
ncbi:hypothetical protein GCM10010532_010710 [Dactylosporangium siamense]|uniref:Uncharacterized protein n=1 Tax=Dactylosporangium siamense TaxID=685454 RepID=A0A919U8M7_9ACTN|nr:hypothetical protein Dsi01nite_009810 [Dactylosporangium siamense]